MKNNIRGVTRIIFLLRDITSSFFTFDRKYILFVVHKNKYYVYNQLP